VKGPGIAELQTSGSAARTQSERVVGTVFGRQFPPLSGCVDFALEGEEKTLPVSHMSSDPVSDTLVG
jgi:hypothetical protein